MRENPLEENFIAGLNSPLRFGAIALGQQAGMRFAYAHPNHPYWWLRIPARR